MYRWSVFVLIAALAWPVGGAAAVVCDTSSAEVMPCCAQGGEDCGTTGMTADCCVLVPGEKLPPASSSSLLDSDSLVRGHLMAWVAAFTSAPAIALDETPRLCAASARAPDYVAPYFARSRVLLI